MGAGMSPSAESEASDIERIRDDLDVTLDALGERVSPRRIAQRRKAAVRAGATRVRIAVMGSAQESGSAVAGQARQVAGSIQEGAQQVREAPEMKDHLQGRARERAQQVKETATEAT